MIFEDKKLKLVVFKLPESEEFEFAARLSERIAMIDGLVKFLQEKIDCFMKAIALPDYNLKRIEWTANRG